VVSRKASCYIAFVLVLATVATSFLGTAGVLPASSFGIDTALSASNASFQGEAPGDQSGRWLGGGGDVNGDGYDDFLIGAKWYGDDGSSKGEVYLILGRGSGWSMDVDLSNANASFVGESAGDQVGPAAIVGDVNGDGYDDILFGAYKNDEGASDAGQSYLIFGKKTGWTMDTALSGADASFRGEGVYDLSGYSVAGAGDVNDDGFDDILIGAPLYGSGDSGQTYLVLGRSSGWSRDTNLASVNASFLGENANDASGMSVAGAGDVNSDGYDDILVGAMNNGAGGTNSGQTYLILGKPTGWAMDTSLSMANASFWGEDSYDYSGQSVAGAGDVNGDGYDDILIGAYGDEDGGANAGQSYLVLGRRSGWAMDMDLSSANASFLGENAGDVSGLPVSGAGDVDGDGYDDFLIGARSNDEGGSDAGQAYLVLGHATGWAMDTDLSGVDASFLGEDSGDMAGSVAGAGDVNGDGNDDILVGAYLDEEGGSSAGQTYLIIYKLGDTNTSDRDNDGFPDSKDAFPDNPFEYVDTDGDGIGDNLDPDADGDGYLDERDAFPLNATEWDDTDLDRTGDNADLDDDNDGIPDAEDAFPKNPIEFMDSDDDGVGDNLDPDDDNDGIADDVEARDELNGRLDDILGAVGLMGDRMERDMAGINRSLQGSLSGLGDNLLLGLEGVNASLATDIEGLLDRITADISGLNASTSARLASMLGALQSDTDSLEGWLDLVMGQVRSNLTEVQGDIRSFQGSTEENLTGISAALEDLQKLEAILQDIDELDQALDQAKSELDRESADRDAEQLGRTNASLALVVVVLLLALLVLVLMFQLRKVAREAPVG